MNHSQPQTISITQGQRQSQLISDPLSSEIPQRIAYKPSETDTLKTPSINNEKGVNMGDYVVLIKDNDISEKKNNDQSNQQKVIKAKEDLYTKEELKVRKERFIAVEAPKTYNKVFGSLDDFLLFFERRGPEIRNFGKMFQEIEVSQDFNRLNQDIVPLLVGSIKEEAAKSSNKQGKKAVIGLFKATFGSFQEFYGAILKAYTIESFLYRNQNQYLRNEDWIRLDGLLPYTFCLFKAFLWSGLSSTFTGNNNQEQQANDRGNDKIKILYRGMQLDTQSLNFYQSLKNQHFSWNAVTSTSTDRDIAAFFMYSNLDKLKTPVMFVIEVPISLDPLKTPISIDMKPYSDFPEEDEMVLAPGSTFELIVFSKKKNDDVVEIHLRLVSNVKTLAYKGQIMHGAMHTETTTDTITRIVGLTRKELSEAICHLKGNRLVEELEITVCKFDAYALTSLVEVLPTISNLARLSCMSLSSKERKDLLAIFKAMTNTKIRKLEIYDRSMDDQQIMHFASGLRYMTSLMDLHLGFRDCNKITDEGVSTLCYQGLQHLTSLSSLHLDFSGGSDKITDKGVSNLCSQGLQYLTSLSSLHLDFEGCSEITNEGVSNLCSEGLQKLTSLPILHLNFGGCPEITDKGVSNLCSQGLQHLTSLSSLHLHFLNCYEVTDKGVGSLCSQGLQHLTSLSSLYLDFSGCYKITDKGVSNLSSQGLQHLTSLSTLHLDFDGCQKITDKGVKNLCSKGLQYLTSLSALYLDFKWCHKITDKGVSSLCSEGLQYLTSLSTLQLYFGECENITDEGLSNLDSQVFQSFPLLKSLHVNFAGTKITHQRIEKLKVQTKMSKISLFVNEKESPHESKLRTFQFKRELKSNSFHATDNDIKSNSDTTLLSSVNLNTISFDSNEKVQQFYTISKNDIPLKFIKDLYFMGNKLTDFIVNDKALIVIGSRLKDLTLLRTLHLDFRMCHEITDKGVRNLCSQGLQNLTSVSTLHLDFSLCTKITHKGVSNLCSKGLQYLTSLSTLYLGFGWCQKITDKGVNNLCSKGLQKLISLSTLHLNLEGCQTITNEGVSSLYFEGIKYLTSLTALHLNFDFCSGISDIGLEDLRLLLKYFGYYY